MAATWITNSSTNVVSMVNTINAACDAGFVPDRIYMLENPDVTEQVAEAMDRATTIVEAYGETPPDVHVTALDDEAEFDRMRSHHQTAIEEALEWGDEALLSRSYPLHAIER